MTYLASRLPTTGQGVIRPAAGGVWDLAMLLYADDLALLAHNLEALAAALDTLEEVAAEWDRTINHDKTELVIIQPPARLPHEHHPSLPHGPHSSNNKKMTSNGWQAYTQQDWLRR